MSDLNLQSVLLSEVDKRGSLNTLELANELNVDHQKIVGCMKSIETFPDVIQSSSKVSKSWNLSSEGAAVHENGSYEFNVYNKIPDQGIEQKELMASLGNPANAKVGFSKAMQNGWIVLDKADGKQLVKKKVDSVNDQIKEILERIKSLKFDEVEDKSKADLKKRKLIEEVSIKSFDITKGKSFTLNLEKPETDLSSEMILKGTWKAKQFKDYNFNALGVVPDKGHLHPLLKVREQYRQIFLEMGFSEMPTSEYVEGSFWNFDALFVPQKHPARDAQDTFFISTPAECKNIPEDYCQAVRQVHSVGGFGSKGYESEWKMAEARKNVLRTHTTASSSKMLYKAAQEYRQTGVFKPMKLFSIDRVFRNETLDATHLAEFFQIEGVVAGFDITLGDLMGTIEAFFKKLGIEELKFKPAFNPYTEPSMEIFSYHKGLKKWVEIGNSGLFRPEMLLPMGLPENVRCAGYGLSLERPTMIKYGLNNIRDLCGHKIDLEMVYNNPVCILGSS